MEGIKTKYSFSLSFYRFLGMVQRVGRFGSAHPHSKLYTLLVSLGVFDKHPADWGLSPQLKALPWGSRVLEAPQPERPDHLQGMWPQTSPFGPDFPPVVLRVDAEERRRHNLKNAARYLGQVLGLSPKFALKASKGRRVVPVSDARFNQLVGETCLAQFFRPLLDPREGRRFAARGDKEIVFLDLSVQGALQPFDGMYLAGGKAYFARVEGNDYEIRAIALDEQIFGAWSGETNWALAKYFILMGLHYQLVVTDHPRLHFPNDVINAITRTALPEDHLLYRLIRPFTHFSLGLNQAVAHHRRSVYHNSQREVYTAFSIPSEEVVKLTSIGWNGLEEKSAFSGYQFGAEPEVGSYYRAFLSDWYGHIYQMVSEVVGRITPGDPQVSQWAGHIAQWLPGFPGEAEIFQNNRLAWAVSNYILSVSVRHSADHYSYASIPLEEMPMRLRVPPPSQAMTESLDLDALVSREDFFRHQMCHALFFQPATLQSIRQVRFGFQEPDLNAAESRFRKGMAALDHKWADSTFPASKDIASSIQY